MSGRTIERQRVIVGEPDQVAAALDLAETGGRLVRCGAVEELDDGRVRVLAVLREPAPLAVRAASSSTTTVEPLSSRRQIVAIAAAVLSALVALAAIVWAVVVTVRAIVAAVGEAWTWLSHVAAPVAGGVLVILLILWLMGRGGGELHCPRCPGVRR